VCRLMVIGRMIHGHTVVAQNTIMYLVNHAHGLVLGIIHRRLITADTNAQINRHMHLIRVRHHLIRARITVMPGIIGTVLRVHVLTRVLGIIRLL